MRERVSSVAGGLDRMGRRADAGRFEKRLCVNEHTVESFSLVEIWYVLFDGNSRVHRRQTREHGASSSGEAGKDRAALGLGSPSKGEMFTATLGLTLVKVSLERPTGRGVRAQGFAWFLFGLGIVPPRNGKSRLLLASCAFGF